MKRTTEVNPIDPPTLHQELARLAQLLSILLGSESIATRLLQQLLVDGESPSIDSLRDRLRYAIEMGWGTSTSLSTHQNARLQATLELGKLLFMPPVENDALIDSPDAAASVVQAAIGWSSVEQFAVLALDCKNRLLSWRILAVGDARETLAPPIEIFRYLVCAGASHGILVHNHPSGCIVPSAGDLSVTEVFLQAGQLLHLLILDHIIVSRGQYISIRAESTLWDAIHEKEKSYSTND